MGLLPEYTVLCCDDGKIELKIELRALGFKNATDISTEIVNGDIFKLLAAEGGCILAVTLPCQVIETSCKARFSTRRGCLSVTAVRCPDASAACIGDKGLEVVSNSTTSVPSVSVHSKYEVPALAKRGATNSILPQKSDQQADQPQMQLQGVADDDALFREMEDDVYFRLPHTTPSPNCSANASQQVDTCTHSTQNGFSSVAQSCLTQAVQLPLTHLDTMTDQHIMSTQQHRMPYDATASLSQPTNPNNPNESAQPAANVDTACTSSQLPHAADQQLTPTAAKQATAVNCCNLGMMLTSAHSKALQSKKAKKMEQRQIKQMLQNVASSLKAHGYAVCDGFLPQQLVRDIRQQLQQMESFYEAGEIWVGKEADIGAQFAVQDVRGDKVLWMGDEALSARAFVKDGKTYNCNFDCIGQAVKAVDKLIQEGLGCYVPELSHCHERSDVMLAIYPGKRARFAKHIDNTANDGRRLTVLCYLNTSWTELLGGALRLYPTGDQPPVDVLPLCGRVAMFYSKTVAHEVLPMLAPRHSFTLWYYDAYEKADAVAAARVNASSNASLAAQSEAREFIRDILAQEKVQATEEGCVLLRTRVAALSPAALRIVATVTGAPSVQCFQDTAAGMTPQGLAELRAELGRMGLVHAPSANR